MYSPARETAFALTIIDAYGTPPRGPPCDARDTHRREGAANNGLSRGDEAELARSQEAPANVKAHSPEHDHQHSYTNALAHHHFAPPNLRRNMPGNSSLSGRSPGFSLVAPVGTVKPKSSDATSAPVFHARTSMLYCGKPVTFV